MRLIILSTLLTLTINLNAQELVLKQDVFKDTIEPVKGPNRKHFRHFFIGYGFIVGMQHNSSEIFSPRSNSFVAGWRYKRKFNNVFSAGLELSYCKRNYRLTYLPGFPLSSSLPALTTGVDREKISFADFNSNFYFRINYGRRGDKVGNFVDLGGGSGWVFYNALTTKYSSVIGKHLTQRIQKYGDREDLILNAIARIGFNRYVFFLNYRLTPAEKTLKDLPRSTVGFQIGLH